jgi:predicted small metal-binding protein
MAKVFYCNDLVAGCKFEARGDSEEEVLAEIADHIAITHNAVNISDEVLARISKAIQEEIRIRAARV